MKLRSSLPAMAATFWAGLAVITAGAHSAETPYPLETCLVSGESLDEMGKPYGFVYQGRELKLCCKPCLKDFKKEPAKYLDQLQAAEKKSSKLKPYPLKNCVVSDEPFGGEMGEPYVFEHKGREVKLCCKSCLKRFNRDTSKYIKKMEEAEKKSRKS